MKTILMLTDFSHAAKNAAAYSLQLARAMKANIKLCHAFKVAAEAPLAGQVVWPKENYHSIKSETEQELRDFAAQLSRDTATTPIVYDFNPLITYTAEVGAVSEVARNLVSEEKLPLAIMGSTGTGGISHFMMGSNCREMIESADFPVLLIPEGFKWRAIKKIAFATDLTPGDIDAVHSLSGLARIFDAEILISHVTAEKFDSGEHEQKINSLLTEVTCKVNYHKIYYRSIKSRNVDSGLDWLAEHGQSDMLAIVHREHHPFFRMLKKSHTEKLVNHIGLPLLVFPPDYHGNI